MDRITITIPRDLVEAADERARDLDRSRSWVLVEALRQYLRAPAGVSEPAVAYRTRLGSYRTRQLRADLRLTPEQRVREAERTARSVPPAHYRRRDQILTFDSFEAYLDWKRDEAAR
jgi:hypothetical protein